MWVIRIVAIRNFRRTHATPFGVVVAPGDTVGLGSELAGGQDGDGWSVYLLCSRQNLSLLYMFIPPGTYRSLFLEAHFRVRHIDIDIDLGTTDRGSGIFAVPRAPSRTTAGLICATGGALFNVAAQPAANFGNCLCSAEADDAGEDENEKAGEAHNAGYGKEKGCCGRRGCKVVVLGCGYALYAM